MFSSVNLTEPVYFQVLKDVFGDRSPTELLKEGLADSKSIADFDAKLKSLKSKWDDLEKRNRVPSSTGYSFYEWFIFYKADLMKKSMIREVREFCGIPLITTVSGDMVEEFTTNVAENANSQIKSWCNQKLPLHEFIKKLQDLVDAQEYQYVEAISGN